MKTTFNTNDSNITFNYTINADGTWSVNICGKSAEVLDICVNTKIKEILIVKEKENTTHVIEPRKRRKYNKSNLPKLTADTPIAISAYMPEKYLIKYNLEHGMRFENRRELEEWCGLGTPNISRWYKGKWIEVLRA